MWEKLRAVIATDVREIESGHNLHLTASEPNAYPGPECILVERGKSPKLGFSLSCDDTGTRMTLRYYLRTNGSRDDKGGPIALKVEVSDEDGELGIVIENRQSSPKTVDEVSELLLRPLLFGDLREVSKLLDLQ